MNSGCAHTHLVFKIEDGATQWHCANCLRGFTVAGDAEVEQALVLARAEIKVLRAVAQAAAHTLAQQRGEFAPGDIDDLDQLESALNAWKAL